MRSTGGSIKIRSGLDAWPTYTTNASIRGGSWSLTEATWFIRAWPPQTGRHGNTRTTSSGGPSLEKNSLTAHVVGAGKTMQLIGTAVRGKQLNRWQKPMLVVPNHMLRQFAGDAQTIYPPSARILVLDKEDITPSRRAEFVARAAMGDWDLVVCTHSSFSRIGVPTHFEAQMLENELVSLRDA